MRFILVLVVLATSSYAYEDCKIDLEYMFWYTNPDTIPDDFNINNPIKTINKLDITNVTTTEGKYIYAEIVDDEIHFKMSPHFKDVEKEVSNLDNYYYNVTLKSEIVFFCAEGTTELSFEQPTYDKNNHRTFFNREIYTFMFGMDLPAGFELTKFMSIFAIDLDFTDEYVRFAVEDDKEDYLKIEETYYDEDSGKVHSAELTLTKDIVAPSEKEFKITARTDRDEEGVAAKATVKIVVHKL